MPANLLGLLASLIGMLVGSVLPTLVPHRGQSIEAAVRHGMAAQHAPASGHVASDRSQPAATGKAKRTRR